RLLPRSAVRATLPEFPVLRRRCTTPKSASRPDRKEYRVQCMRRSVRIRICQKGSSTSRSGDSRGERRTGGRSEKRVGPADNCIASGMTAFVQMAADRDHVLREATFTAARAIELDSTDALSYALRGYCVMLGRQFDRYSEALKDAQLAHEVNPNDMFVLGILAWVSTSGPSKRLSDLADEPARFAQLRNLPPTGRRKFCRK